MPKVSIREIDVTGGETREFLNYTVVVPGPVIGYLDSDNENEFIPLNQGLLVSQSQLAPFNLVGVIDSEGELDENLTKENENSEAFFEKDSGFKMINELLRRGLTVYYVPAYGQGSESQAETYTFELKLLDDFHNAVAKDATGTEFNNPFNNLKLNDRGFCDVRFITLGGMSQIEDFVDDGETNEIFDEIAKCALECAGDRGDAVALLDVPTKNSEGEDLVATDDIDKWVQDTFEKIATTAITREGVSWTDSDNETYGRYGAIFAPHFVSKFNEEQILPGSFNYLACFSKYIKNFKDWFAMSGSVRGVSPFANLTPTVEFGDNDVNILQPRDAGNPVSNGGRATPSKEYENEDHIATNVICNIRPYGNVIWGNRTMHPLNKPNNGDSDAIIQLTASSFLNIRHLCIDIKKTLYRAARRFAFEPNSDDLWFNFKGAITPLLDEMKANQGIRGYQVIRVKTKKKALFVARIKIIPVEAVEDFDLTVELADSIEVTEE